MTRYLFALAALIAAPASAQSLEGIWKDQGDRIAAPAAHITFPRTIAGLSLTKSGEVTHKGEALDNSAEYNSADRTLWATIYLYLPGYADAALTANVTDRTLHAVYGSKINLVSQGVAAIGGRPGAAIRAIYVDGELNNSGPLASGAAFARVGPWIVKFRVSGPRDRQAEVEATLDAFLQAVKFDNKAAMFPVAPLQRAEPCPAQPSGAVVAVHDENGGANALAAAVIASSVSVPPDKKSKLPPAFPANGLTPVCSRGMVELGQSRFEVLQPAGERDPSIILLQLNDRGDVVTVRKNLLGNGYTLGKAEIARFTVLGVMDRLPDNIELAKIMSGAQPELLKVRASTTLRPDGGTTLNIDPDALKK